MASLKPTEVNVRFKHHFQFKKLSNVTSIIRSKWNNIAVPVHKQQQPVRHIEFFKREKAKRMLSNNSWRFWRNIFKPISGFWDLSHQMALVSRLWMSKAPKTRGPNISRLFVFTRLITHAQFKICRTCALKNWKPAKVASGFWLSQSPWHFDPADRKCARALGTRLAFFTTQTHAQFKICCTCALKTGSLKVASCF